jgi:hypothetical protein
VVDSRYKVNTTRRYRRRECMECGFRFSTMECYLGKNAMWNQAINEAISRLRGMKKEGLANE